jgi:outer membrane protein assembly factor BamD (BamD/ComL family)
LGRKRNRTRKYLYLSIACMIFLSLAGCAALKEMKAKREVREYLITAQKLLAQGDYEGALKENQKVLLLNDSIPPGDEALFNAGLIYAHDGYPKRDYQKSLGQFKRLVKVFPQSPFAQQAKIWIGILQENERGNRETEELNKSIRRSQQENEKLMRETEELNKSIRKSQQENERLKRDIEELNKAITKSKQVDIEIDEKKKEILK